MKKITRITKILGGLLCVVPLFLMLSSCEKFLDRKPLTATLNDLNQGGVEPQIIGLYGAIRNQDNGDALGFCGLSWLGMHAIRADDQFVGTDPGAATAGTQYDNYQYQKDEWNANNYYTTHYSFLNRCNTALYTIDSLKLTDEQSLKNAAEARWFRAFTFFDLVRTYGEVPIINFPIKKPTDNQLAKSTIAQVYAQIDADLTFAEQYLPMSWATGTTNQYPGRLTVGAAKTLHAKTYLYRKQWAQSLSKANDVIGSGVYSLHSDYWSLWKTKNENCEESIFEIQAFVGAGGTNNYGSFWGTEQGIRGTGQWNLGWGYNMPTQTLIDAYETGDTRKSATILYAGQSDDPSNGGYGLTLPAETVLGAKYFNKKLYADPAEQSAAGNPHENAYTNVRVLRYADVLLMAAEAANENGDGATAAKYIEMIRARARNGSATALPKIAFKDQAQMRAAIKQERRIEFAMEGERFFDLVRWGDALAVLSAAGYKDKNKYFPIPQPVIDQSGGKLIQNADY